MATARFTLGRLVATPGALLLLTTLGQEALRYFHRHEAGDWRDMAEESTPDTDRRQSQVRALESQE